MSRFAHHHPEDPQGEWDRMVDRADHARKEARENAVTPDDTAPLGVIDGRESVPRKANTEPHYTGLLTFTIAQLLNLGPAVFDGARASQHQQNGLYGAHQLAVKMSFDDTRLYRVIVAPADAPITIGGIPADQHFAEPIGRE